MSAKEEEKSMLTAKYRVDIPLGGDGTQFETLICVHTNEATEAIEYAIGRGRFLLVCDGNSDEASVLRRFDVDFDIKKIFYHKFFTKKHVNEKAKKERKETTSLEEIEGKRQPRKEFLVVCGEHRLVFVATHDYHFYHYDIPFKLRNVHATSGGILVERFYDSTVDQTLHYHDTFHLYSLSNPFGELLPVIYKTSGFLAHWKFCWQSQDDDATMIGSADSFVLVFDRLSKTHRIYLVRDTEEDEVRAAIRFVELQRMNDSTYRHHPVSFSMTPRQATEAREMESFQSFRSPAVIALSEIIDSEIEACSPHPNYHNNEVGFGHSTPNNPNFSSATPSFNIEAGTSDPKMFSQGQGTPRIKMGGKNLERNIHTRSLARMAHADDQGASSSGGAANNGSELRMTPLTQRSPYPLSNSGMSHGSLYGLNSSQLRTPKLPRKMRKTRVNQNAELLRDFTRMIRETSRINGKGKSMGRKSSIGELERDPDLDLLLSNVCLECIFIEPRQDHILQADKMFVSRTLTQYYLNYVSHEMRTMRTIRVWRCNDGRGGVGSKDGQSETKEKLTSVQCYDATYVQLDGLTAVLQIDNSIALYAGDVRISMVFVENMPMFSLSSKPHLHPYVGNNIMLMTSSSLTRITLPDAYGCAAVTSLVRHCLRNVPMSFAHELYTKWRSQPRESVGSDVQLPKYRDGGIVAKEVRDAMRFLLHNVGVTIENIPERERSVTPEVGGKQRKPRRCGEELWERINSYLAEDETLKTTSDEPKSECSRKLTASVDGKCKNLQFARSVFIAIHAQFIEWTLGVEMHNILPTAVTVLYAAARCLGEKDHVDFYEMVFDDVISSYEFEFTEENSHPVPTAPSEPLCVYSTIAGFSDDGSKINATSLALATRKCVRILIAIATGFRIPPMEADLVHWFGATWPHRVGLKGAKAVKKFLTVVCDTDMGAEERMANTLRFFNFTRDDVLNWPVGIRVFALRNMADAYAGMKDLEPRECYYATEDEQTMIMSARWPNDIRGKNVESMLDGTRPALIAVNVLGADEETNMKDLQDRFLTQTAVRYFAQSFGRSLYQFRTEVPSLLQTLDVPALALGGVVYPARVTCDPPGSDTFKSHNEWSDFFNSVSSAMRVGPNDLVKIDSEWMMMVARSGKNVPSVAGMTLGFGLNGHLNQLNMYTAHTMLATLDRFHSVALLLGLAASKFKTCDMQIYKILATHLHFLMGPTLLDIRMDCTVQTAAISALGLLFADSGNMNIAKKLVNEIGRSPNPEEEPVSDRCAYKLSAGFSLGLIMLGKGNGQMASETPFKQTIPSLSQRLLVMLNGGLRDHCVFTPQNPMPVVTDYTPQGVPIPGVGFYQTNTQPSNHIKEGRNVNMHIAAQPAAVALGLMFLKTNDEYIGQQLALPASITEIERIRPDVVFARILSYSLVMWDQIIIDDNWVNNRVPEVIQRYMQASLKFGGEEDDDFLEYEVDEDDFWDEVVDRQTLAQVYLHAIAGALFAMALKFSSNGIQTSESDAVFELIERFASIVLPKDEHGKRTAYERVCHYAGPTTVTSVLSTMVMSMALLKAGTGDLRVLRYARLLRSASGIEKWLASGRTHHEQMTAHQAMGITMMGGGRFAFKIDDMSIALSVISFYPMIAQNVSDNTHYHQPLRFVWSLAVEPRLIVPIDAVESTVVACDVHVALIDSYGKYVSVKAVAPCLLPPVKCIRFIEIGGGKFEMHRINLTSDDEKRSFEEILGLGLGRVRVRRYASTFEAEGQDEQLRNEGYVSEVGDWHNIVLDGNIAGMIDDKKYQNMMRNVRETQMTMDHTERYPQVQMTLDMFKEELERDQSRPTGLNVMDMKLLHKFADRWSHETSLAFEIGELAEQMREKVFV